MDAYLSRDERVKYLRKPVNKGLIDSLDMGWRHSTGEYLAFFDSDDVMMPTRIEKQVRLMESRPDVGLVFTRFIYMDSAGRLLRKTPYLPEEDHLEHLVHSCFIMQNSVTARRSTWDSIGGFDLSLKQVEDWWALLGMLLNGKKFAPIQEPLYRARIHPNNQTRNTRAEEEDLQEILGRVFSDPRVPPKLHLQKQAAYAYTAFWSAYGYYNGQNWDDAKRCFSRAWAMTPRWQADHNALVSELREVALTVWTPDPVQFMQGVLDHLPPEMSWLNQHSAELMSAMHLGAGFRHIEQREFGAFYAHMQQAHAADSRVVSMPDFFINRMCIDAEASPNMTAVQFVEAVMAHLPPGMAALRKFRERALSEVSLDSAFADYRYGHRTYVLRHVIDAIRHQPSLAKNRGVVSIFLRSISGSAIGALIGAMLGAETGGEAGAVSGALIGGASGVIAQNLTRVKREQTTSNAPEPSAHFTEAD
jgi:tetratricopeptide (TPR) repeat protein